MFHDPECMTKENTENIHISSLDLHLPQTTISDGDDPGHDFWANFHPKSKAWMKTEEENQIDTSNSIFSSLSCVDFVLLSIPF